MIELKRTTSENIDFQKLEILLEAYLKIIDGDDHVFYAQLNKINILENVIVCYFDGTAIGCGAFRKFDEKTIEIKRMFVKPEFRRNKFANSLLAELESWAIELNYSQFILETGKKQPEAIGFYEKAGYEFISNFGQYINSENSICMKKETGKWRKA